MAQIVLFVALPEEAEHIYAALIGSGFRCGLRYNQRISSYTLTYSQRHKLDLDIVLVAIGDMGNRRVASRVQPVLISEGPVIVIMAGIAGTLDTSSAQLGDVIIAASAKGYYVDKIKQLDKSKEIFSVFKNGNPIDLPQIGHENKQIIVESRKRFLEKSFFRFRRELVVREGSLIHLSGYCNSLDGVRELKMESVIVKDRHGEIAFKNENPKIVVATMLGSDSVVDSQEYVDFLVEKNTPTKWDYYTQKNVSESIARNIWIDEPLAAVDMETLGFLDALDGLKQASMIGFVVRGISDMSSNKEGLDTSGAGVRAIAAKNAAIAVVDILRYLVSKNVAQMRQYASPF